MNTVSIGRVERLEMAVSLLLRVMDRFRNLDHDERLALADIASMINDTTRGEVVQLSGRAMSNVNQFLQNRPSNLGGGLRDTVMCHR